MPKSGLSIAAPGRKFHLVAFCMALCAASAALSPASGQSDQGYVPRREGNIYGHKAHQPTARDVCPRGVKPSINCPSESARRLVEDEVQRLLHETDMASGSARQLLDHPNGNAPSNAGGR